MSGERCWVPTQGGEGGLIRHFHETVLQTDQKASFTIITYHLTLSYPLYPHTALLYVG